MTRGKAKPKAPERLVDCRGCRTTQVGVLEVICPPCLAELPPGLRDAYDRSRRGAANLPRRFAAEDAAVAWLTTADRAATT